jgi:hypothetical protein
MEILSAAQCYEVFEQSVNRYHEANHVDSPVQNPYPEGQFENLLYAKNWIDTVQWHLEDIIREPTIDPLEGMKIKRRIDKSNQDRTDLVERIDDHFRAGFSGITPQPGTRINSETPAWLLDRMSILVLKIYHMREQTHRADVDTDHISKCTRKLEVLLEQREDMGRAFDELMTDIQSGIRTFKVYRQMKMYNDASLNPVLYQQKK